MHHACQTFVLWNSRNRDRAKKRSLGFVKSDEYVTRIGLISLVKSECYTLAAVRTAIWLVTAPAEMVPAGGLRLDDGHSNEQSLRPSTKNRRPYPGPRHRSEWPVQPHPSSFGWVLLLLLLTKLKIHVPVTNRTQALENRQNKRRVFKSCLKLVASLWSMCQKVVSC